MSPDWWRLESSILVSDWWTGWRAAGASGAGTSWRCSARGVLCPSGERPRDPAASTISTLPRVTLRLLRELEAEAADYDTSLLRSHMRIIAAVSDLLNDQSFKRRFAKFHNHGEGP